MIYPVKFDKDNLDFIMGYIDECNDPEETFDFYVNMFLRIGIEQTKKAFNDPDWFETVKMKIKKELNEGEL